MTRIREEEDYTPTCSSSSNVDKLDAGRRPLCPIHCAETNSNHKAESALLRLPVYNMSAFQLYGTSWFSPYLSRRALNVFVVGDETT